MVFRMLIIGTTLTLKVCFLYLFSSKLQVFQPHKDEENRWTVEKTKPCPKGAYPAPRKHHSCVQWKNGVLISFVGFVDFNGILRVPTKLKETGLLW